LSSRPTSICANRICPYCCWHRARPSDLRSIVGPRDVTQIAQCVGLPTSWSDAQFSFHYARSDARNGRSAAGPTEGARKHQAIRHGGHCHPRVLGQPAASTSPQTRTQSPACFIQGPTGFRRDSVGPCMRGLPGTVQTKTGMILATSSGTRRALGGDAVCGAVVNAAHREGCCLRTDNLATVSETKKLQSLRWRHGSQRAES
jgi:hypothetical protein